jgi:hypothetical protein
LGAVIGAVVWIPALVLTLLCFGLPIWRAERLAAQGLAGRERGEVLVGAAAAALSGLALPLALLAASSADAPLRPSALWITPVLAALGLGTGVTTTAMAWLRGARRKAFVARVEAGEVEHFRVDTTEAGKVLVRVVPQGEGYRVADFEEAVAELTAAGETTRVMPAAVESTPARH